MNKILASFFCLFLICSCFKAVTTKLTIKTENGNIVYNVETASKIEDLEKGLMGRESLAADGGMLFDLSAIKGKVTAMWMKDTNLTLDMLFLTKDGDIFWIKENAEPNSEELIIAPFPAAAVLEINGGEVAKQNIKVGQKVEHPLFKRLSQEKTEPVSEETNVIKQ